MRKLFLLSLALMATITMWATPTQSYVLTGYSTQIANGKCVNIGGAYCGRKGSNYTPNATYGLPSGNGNVAAVFTVNQTSTITFIMDNQQTSAKSGSVLLASVSDSYYSDCQSGTLGNLPSTASQTKDVSFAKNADSGENEFTFESSVSAGKYIIYWTNSINSSIYLKRIEINSDVKYSVTINPNGGDYAATPDGWTKTDGKYTKSDLSGSFNVPEGLTYSGYDLNGWKDGQGNDITLPITLSHDTTIIAQWVEHTTSTDATLSAFSIDGYSFNETFDPANTDYTVTLPFYASAPAVSAVHATKNNAYASVGDVTYDGTKKEYSVTVTAENTEYTKTYTITLNWAATPTASSSINIEQLVLDNSKSYNIGSALDAAHISYANLNSLDSLAVGDKDNDRPDYNETFLGLKIKKSGGYIQMVIPAGETLKVKFGSVAANLKLTINEVAQTDIDKSTSVYEHTASGNELIKIATSSDKTVVLKQIMVGGDIAVVRPFLATVAPTTNGTASVELPKYAKGDQVTVNCKPDSGYQLDNIAVSGFASNGAATEVEVTDGKFTMPGSPVTITVTFSVATALDNTDVNAKAVKRLENGLLVIEKNGVRYNAMGQTIR